MKRQDGWERVSFAGAGSESVARRGDGQRLTWLQGFSYVC